MTKTRRKALESLIARCEDADDVGKLQQFDGELLGEFGRQAIRTARNGSTPHPTDKRGGSVKPVRNPPTRARRDMIEVDYNANEVADALQTGLGLKTRPFIVKIWTNQGEQLIGVGELTMRLLMEVEKKATTATEKCICAGCGNEHEMSEE